jgi:hypothetical protein
LESRKVTKRSFDNIKYVPLLTNDVLKHLLID